MKKIFLIGLVLFLSIVAFIGCHKDPLDYGNVGMLNLNLKRGYKTTNKSALESFDARVTIYYGSDDTVAYNCRFIDADGDGRYVNDPSVLESIYVRREVGFWVGVRAVIQGDTVTGMSEPNRLLYLSEDNPVLDVDIVLVAGYPRIVISSNTEVVGEDFLIFGEVLEGMEMLEQYGFAVKRGQPSEEEKRLWAKRLLTESDFDDLYSLWNYEFYDAEIYDNEAKRFGCALEMQDFDSAEYTVVAVAALRMTDDDSIPAAIHSPVVSMTISGSGAHIEEYVYIDEPYYNGDTITLYGYYEGNRELYECGFVLGFSEYELTDSMPCRQTDAIFSLALYNLQNTTYYYRAYVKTADGIIESEIGQFQVMGMIQEFAVYTQSATDITETSATLNGYVTSTDGIDFCGFILNMGTYNDTLMVQPSAEGYFSYQVSNLAGGTTYYYQAFVNRSGWDFGEEISFTTAISEQQEPSYSQPTGYMDGYGYVDLGLPSGTLWAYTNIGANTPEDYGNYYAWGETETKETYDWITYKYCNGSETTLTKYCNGESYGLDGFTDSLTTLDAVDDAAFVNWGGNWRMPTQDEMQELVDNCDTTRTTPNGINGMLFTSRSNGNSIFLPAAGSRNDSDLDNAGSVGNYWSSSLGTYGPHVAWYLYFHSRLYGMDGDVLRYCGQSVRPVCVQYKKIRK